MVVIDLSTITMIPVNSSTLVQLGYDKGSSQMVAEFQKGSYMYGGISQDEFDGIINAKSPGQALRNTVKGKEYEKLS